MKAIINQQIALVINNPVCYGLLVESKHSLQHEFCQKTHCKLLGYDCYLYKMPMQYEADYRSNLIAQLRTLRDVLDIMLLLPAINILSYLDVMMYIYFHKLMSC
ncbi:uncharacterized protein RHIMIDRAFT_4568 [Rhizopus microsporus ATCC 52813]|uniref:Uncharacterized protein n=1 Tax=Rhizopus microsporus ATCC 52813 TaxID=1340429 RepID=A0A2G4T849_RHIZD|nr:uncharacterized protein RHIMIDRAFT_4568 [Rhizopus microsporus ATCC 52813]PHZ17202.1 hypothetical protein RHIMIDRAFT_4568 [Rhizopus microsporus ATCC 52813]